MIEVFTLGAPGKILQDFSDEIFLLPKGAYNLPAINDPRQKLFDKLYTYGVRQIVVYDEGPEEIRCMDGHLFAEKMGRGQTLSQNEILVISRR